MATFHTDVLVVGSGFGAAPPAVRLAEAGIRVTMIERGPSIVPQRDFRQTQDPRYLLRYLKSYGGENISLLCAEALGGGSGFYEMVSLRAPSLAFEQEDGAGRRLWPAGVDRPMLDPFYARAEEMLGVRQLEPHEIPKTGLVFARMMKDLGYTTDVGRYAVGRCLGSGFCVTGCIYGAKRSLHLNYLPRARDAGVVIHTGTEARRIRPLRRSGRSAPERGVQGEGSLERIPCRYEVECVRAGERPRPVRYRAKLVVLAGGTVGTAALLLRSARQLPELSPHVGRNIAFNGSAKAAGLLADHLPDGDMFTGMSHPGVLSYEFLESHGIVVTAAKPLPLQAVASARLRLDGDPREPATWGPANVELMKRFRRRGIVLVAFGLTPPAAVLSLARDEPRVDLQPTEDLKSYREVATGLLHSILRENGCRILHPEFIDAEGHPHPDLFFSTAHQVGSCRMGDSPERGVVDGGGEVFGYPGLFVTDGAAIPTSLAVNTSLTILANAERIADRLVRRYGGGSGNRPEGPRA